MNELGLHLLLEMQNCDEGLLKDPRKTRRILYDVARKSGMTPLKDVFHTFTPHGVSGVLLLAESHVSLHTWPEFGYAAVDFFTCNTATDMKLVEELFVDRFRPTDFESSVIKRGERVLTPHRIEQVD